MVAAPRSYCSQIVESFREILPGLEVLVRVGQEVTPAPSCQRNGSPRCEWPRLLLLSADGSLGQSRHPRSLEAIVTLSYLYCI